MSDAKPDPIVEFPLLPNSAKRLINEIANNFTSRIFIGKHAKERMLQRNVTRMQLLNVLRNKHSRITEDPHLMPNGDWKCNLQGMSAGDLIEVVVSLKKHDYDPSVYIVTVMIK